MSYFVGPLLPFASFFRAGIRYIIFDVHIVTSCFSRYSYLFHFAICVRYWVMYILFHFNYPPNDSKVRQTAP